MEKKSLVDTSKSVRELLDKEIIEYIHSEKANLEKKHEHDSDKRSQILFEFNKNVTQFCTDGVKALKKDLESMINSGKEQWSRDTKREIGMVSGIKEEAGFTKNISNKGPI